MMMMMMIKVSDVGHKLPGLNPAPDIAFLPHPVLLYNALPLYYTLHSILYTLLSSQYPVLYTGLLRTLVVNIPESTDEQQ